MGKYLFVSIISLVAASCSPKTQVVVSNELRYGELSEGLPDKDSTITENYTSGKIKASGRYALDYDLKLSDLKSGYWKEYYENGSLKNEGNYKLGSYLQCSMGGLWREYYYYRDGIWKYYNEKSELEFEVEFTPNRLYLETSCEGGDSLTFGLIKSVLPDYSSILTPDKIYELQKMKIKQDFGSIHYIPLNGSLYIKWQKED